MFTLARGFRLGPLVHAADIDEGADWNYWDPPGLLCADRPHFTRTKVLSESSGGVEEWIS